MPFLDTNARARLRQQDSGWAWKTIFRLVILFFDVLALIILAAAAGMGNTGVWPAFLPIIVSFIYTIITTSLAIFRRKIIHPGFNVGIDLVLWLGFLFLSLAAIGLTWVFAAAADEYVNGTGSSSDGSGDSSDPGDSGTGDSVLGNGQPGQCPDFNSCDDAISYFNKVINVSFAGTAFGFLLALLHLIVFIDSCIATHRYNTRMRTNHNADFMNYNGQQGYPMHGMPRQTPHAPVTDHSVPPYSPNRASAMDAEEGHVVPEKAMGQYPYGHA